MPTMFPTNHIAKIASNTDVIPNNTNSAISIQETRSKGRKAMRSQPSKSERDNSDCRMMLSSVPR